MSATAPSPYGGDGQHFVVFDEMREGPEIATRLLKDGMSSILGLAAQIRKREIRHVVVAARGSSSHAGLVAKYVWEFALRIPVSTAAPSLYTLYRSHPLLSEQTLVVGISQSGAAPDVSKVVSEARKSGALTVAITNSRESLLARTAEHVVDVQAASEHSIPATKTYLAEILVVYMLAAALAPSRVRFANLERLPERWNDLLAVGDCIKDQVASYGDVRQAFVIGRGVNCPTALEIALKLKEMCYVKAEGYSSAEFLHGPIVLVESGYPIMLLAPPGPSLAGNLELARLLLSYGARLVVISSEPEALGLADAAIEVPSVHDEIYSPLHYVIPGYLFAAHLAVVKGLDPDQPRGLAKVMETL